MESTKLSAMLVLAMLALSSSPVALAWEKAEPECNSCQGGGSPPSSGGSGGVVTPIIGGVTPVVGGVTPVVGGVVGGVTPVVGGVVGGVTPVVGGVTPVVGGVVGGVTPVVGGIIGGGSPKKGHGRKGCPPPPPPPTPTPSSDKCPINVLKLGACVDVLGSDVHIGDASVTCCPLLKGIAGLSAAACLCTAIKAKVLDISLYVPVALEILLNCGCAIPPGYKCA